MACAQLHEQIGRGARPGVRRRHRATSIEYTCSDGQDSFSQTLTLTATGVNTAKLDQLERFVKRFPIDGVYMTADDLHTRLDEIAQTTASSYTRSSRGLASALACGGFTFLLGGGPIRDAAGLPGRGRRAICYARG